MFRAKAMARFIFAGIFIVGAIGYWAPLHAAAAIKLLAARPAALINMTGLWSITWDVNGAPRNAQLDLKSQGNSVWGSYVGKPLGDGSVCGAVGTKTNDQFNGTVYTSARGSVLSMMENCPPVNYLAPMAGYFSGPGVVVGTWVDTEGRGGHFKMQKQ